MQSFEVFFDVRLKHLLKKNNRFFGEFIPYVHDARLTSLLCLIDCLEWILRNHISLDMGYNRALWFGQVSPHMSKLHIMCLTKWLGRQEFCFCTPITTTTPTHEWYFFVQGTLRNHISDVTRKKNWDSLLISAIFQNGHLRFLISRKLHHVGSWFAGLNLYFLDQGFR